jgi:hypothetical protein
MKGEASASPYFFLFLLGDLLLILLYTKPYTKKLNLRHKLFIHHHSRFYFPSLKGKFKRKRVRKFLVGCWGFPSLKGKFKSRRTLIISEISILSLSTFLRHKYYKNAILCCQGTSLSPFCDLCRSPWFYARLHIDEIF